MDIDPQDIIETARAASEAREQELTATLGEAREEREAQRRLARIAARKEARSARLNAAVAVTVALLATFMGICKVKDDNINQGMQQAQADKLDHWAFYQSRNLRQEVAEATATQLELARASIPTTAPATSAAAYTTAITRYRTLADDEAKKKADLRAQATADQQTYDALNYRDDQFDLSDALLAIAIAMLAVTALTRLWPLYWAALVPTGFGVLMGMAGLAGLHIHPDALVKLLS